MTVRRHRGWQVPCLPLFADPASNLPYTAGMILSAASGCDVIAPHSHPSHSEFRPEVHTSITDMSPSPSMSERLIRAFDRHGERERYCHADLSSRKVSDYSVVLSPASGAFGVKNP